VKRSSLAPVVGAGALAAGAVGWYFYQFGEPLHAMTPAEEGYVNVNSMNYANRIVSILLTIPGSIRNGGRRMMHKRM
jgi:hypothetical protein